METLLPCNQAADPSLIKVVFHHTIYMKFYRFYIILATWRIAQVYIFGIMLRVIGKSLYGSTFNRTFRTPRQFTIPMTNMTSLVAQTVKHLSTMQETWVRSLGWEDPLEKEMAIHSRTIAWKIPWTEEPGGLQSMGSQRVEHDWVSLTDKHDKYNRVYFLRKFNKLAPIPYTLSAMWPCHFSIKNWSMFLFLFLFLKASVGWMFYN